MKKLIFAALISLVTGLAYSQTEFNNFELNFKGGYGATPKEIIEIMNNDSVLLDTVRLGEVNGFEVGGAAYLNCGLGLEFNYASHNRYFDTLAGSGNSYIVGLAFRKVFMGPGSLFDAGFNTAFKVGAGYIHASKTDQIEYLKTNVLGVTTSSVWKREKSFSGFYVDGNLIFFRDNPFNTSDYLFYSASLSGSIKYPMMNKLSESKNDTTIKASWDKGDSVSVVNIGLEIKPVIIPLNDRLGISLITAVSYGNFNAYNVHDPGFNFKVGLSLDGFGKLGECARITYTRASRADHVSNEFSFGIEVIQTCRNLFGN